jgi:DNA-3-methyladenine glycosylase II
MEGDPTTMKVGSPQIQLAVRKLSSTDPVLGTVIRAVGPFTLKPRRGGYQMLVRSILSQQISTSAATTIRQRLVGLLPNGILSADEIAKLTDSQLQAVGISKQKQSYIRDLTERTLDGSLNYRRLARRDDEDAIAELIQVRGVGRWTAQMYLMFCLGRPDLFPVDDLGIQNAMKRLYGLPQKPERSRLEEIAIAWAPFRTVASWYLWRSLDL